MKKIVCVLLALLTLLALTGCGNMDIFDTNYTMNFIVIREGNESTLHRVESWSDSESDSVTVRTACCGNYIWTSVNNATLYESEPSATAYTHACEHLAK
jgi:iron only hydrogenase large subunit-like protein